MTLYPIVTFLKNLNVPLNVQEYIFLQQDLQEKSILIPLAALGMQTDTFKNTL